MPGRVGMIAGIFFGFAFGAGGIAAAALGALADVKGIEFVFWLCSFLPLAGLLTVFLPPMPVKHPEPGDRGGSRRPRRRLEPLTVLLTYWGEENDDVPGFCPRIRRPSADFRYPRERREQRRAAAHHGWRPLHLRGSRAARTAASWWRGSPNPAPSTRGSRSSRIESNLRGLSKNGRSGRVPALVRPESPMSKRYAIYYAPATASPLWQRAAQWLGRDATGRDLEPATIPGVSPSRRQELTTLARRYGFHGTIKAPMALPGHQTVGDLERALTEFTLEAPAGTDGAAPGDDDRRFPRDHAGRAVGGGPRLCQRDDAGVRTVPGTAGRRGPRAAARIGPHRAAGGVSGPLRLSLCPRAFPLPHDDRRPPSGRRPRRRHQGRQGLVRAGSRRAPRSRPADALSTSREAGAAFVRLGDYPLLSQASV